MIAVDGIILVISCQKHLQTRLKEINLKEDYGNWKVINVIGDLFLDCDYKLEGNLMTIKCEDSYLHLLKKLVLSFKYLSEIFDIKEGILKCNDDLIFNENILESFLKSPKKHKINDREYIDIDYTGRTNYGIESSGTSGMIMQYYQNHPEDFNNPLHNLKEVDIAKFSKIVQINIRFVFGPLTYFSNKSCKILINHMTNINYNIHHFDEKTKTYPYAIEDYSIGYILSSNNINVIHSNYWYGDLIYNTETDKWIIDNKDKFIALHTNKYK
jgi:hypothetical protein